MNPDSPMESDKYQQAWKASASRARVTIAADLLLNEVQRNQQDFRAKILRRDVMEVGVGLVMIPVWFFLGAMWSLPWSWYLSVPALIWIVGFFLVDRMRHLQTPSEPGEPLLQCVRNSLTQLEHQIWLLHNIFWWYLLPPTISLMAFFAHVAWLDSRDWWEALAPMLFVAVLYAGIYYLNQFAVRRQLEPRRQELLALLTSLKDETNGTEEGTVESGNAAPIKSAASVKTSVALGRPVSFMVLLATITILASVAAFFTGRAMAGYPKVSPFAAVRWQESQPEVKVDDQWFKLVSIDNVPATEIVAFSKKTYDDLWRKRFEEDLVEVLAGMGKELKDTVRLVLMPLGLPKDSKEQTLEEVPMTAANRRAIRNAAQAREQQLSSGIFNSSYDGPARSSGPTGESLAKLITDERKEKNLVGLAAMVTVDGQVEAAAAHGERKIGSGVPLEIADRWHLGGITKSITATMIARLVEAGQMQWSDTVGEIFPEAAIHEDWQSVTLRHLLTDTAGAPPNFPREVSSQRPPLGAEGTKARREAVLGVIAYQPAYPPGEKYVYSNVGYSIAGAMAEKVTGANWEDLVKREVFEPLELTESGFGPPQSGDDTLEQPRGHRARLPGKAPVDDDTDNSSIMGPAGIVHMSLGDLSTYATEHLRGALGEGKLLSAETYKLLHTPELDDYACGWIRKEPSADIPHTVYWHNGSNTLWYALVVFIPEKNMVIAVTSNDGDIESAEAAAWEVVKDSVKQINVGVDPIGLEQEQGMRPAVPINDGETPLTDMITDLRKEKKLVGLAAMVVVDGQVVDSAVDGERK